jgi:hypothetical protein
LVFSKQESAWPSAPNTGLFRNFIPNASGNGALRDDRRQVKKF